jgi:16S rRNA G966 N2-methylase RsmD
MRMCAGQKWDNVKAVAPSIRVSSGTARGRKLTSPDVYLRPMMGKVKEALFSVSPHTHTGNQSRET